MLLLKINRTSGVPAYKQVCDQIVALTDESALLPGDRLPATRALGASIGLHRSSVVRAYNELRALGYLESRPGSYSTIRQRQRLPTSRTGNIDREADKLIDWDAVAQPCVRRLSNNDKVATLNRDDLIDFDRLCADPALAPHDELRRCLKTELIKTGGTALDYADPSGWLPLREVIAKRMCNHGIKVSTEEVLITSGAQQALDLVLRYLTSPGDRIVVEAPTYGMLHSLLKLHEVEPVEVPLLNDGMDLDSLQRVLQITPQPPKFVFSMPNFHNPTGITTSQQHRERLLALCEAYRIPLLEDGFEEEMKYFGQAVLPVKSMDSGGIVLYVGTFSKVVFPGLRIGWICAPRGAVEKLHDIKHAACISGNTLAQAAAARFCRSGKFDAYLRRMHRIYRRRMQVLLKGLKRHMPGGVQWTSPGGGYTVWLCLPDLAMPEDELLDKIKRGGLLIGPGHHYFANPPASTHFRLSIACVDERKIETGCRLLGEVLEDAING